MLKSKRTVYSPLFGETNQHYLLNEEDERQKYYDVQATKALILEAYNANTDEEHLGKSLYYVGGISEQMKYRVLGRRRASLSDVRSIKNEHASHIFSFDVVADTLSRAYRDKCHLIDLERLYPSFLRLCEGTF